MKAFPHNLLHYTKQKDGKGAAATPHVFEVEINKIIGFQNPQLVMLPTVYLKDGSQTRAGTFNCD